MNSPQPEAVSAERMSLPARLANIVAAPGEVFDSVRHTPVKPMDWLGPLLVCWLAAVLHVCVIFSQPAVLQKIRDQQEAYIDRAVEQGKIPATQRDAAVENARQFAGPGFLKAAGSAGAGIAIFFFTFLFALGLWLVGRKALHGNFPFMKAVEVTALASVIGALGAMVTMLVIVAKGESLANLGPVLALEKVDVKNKVHLVLVSLNLMTLWQVGVLGLGLAKLANVKAVRGMVWTFGGWALLRALAIWAGWAEGGM